MSYAIEWKPSARKEVRRLDVEVRRRIRVGAYRVVYEIRDDVLVVLVLRVGGRGPGTAT